MPETPQARGQWEQTQLGKILRVLGTGERFGTRAVLKPLAERIADPQTRSRLQGLEGDIYAGDVINTVFPPSEFASPFERLARGASAALVGGAVDPLSYIGVGRLTKVGKAAKMAGRLAETAGEQAKLGQKALLTVGGKGIVPARVSAAAYDAAAAAQRGHLAEAALNRVGLPQVGAFWDRLVNSSAQRFGFHIGADPYLMRAHQELFGKITGTGKLTADQTLSELEPLFEDMAHRFSSRLGISPEEAYSKVKAAVFEAQDALPDMQLAREAKTFVQTARKTEYDRAREAIVNNFGLPPSFGGPASVTDNEMIRGVRNVVVRRKRAMANILAREEQELEKTLRLVTDPDAGYQAGMISNEARGQIEKYRFEKMIGTIIGGNRKGITNRPPPTEKIANHIASRMRVINPQVYHSMSRSGVFDPIVQFSKKGRRNTISPREILQADMGKPLSKKGLKMIDRLIQEGRLSLDSTAPNYAGSLVPRIPVSQRNKFIFENGWGKTIKPGTVKEFFVTDPTAIDAARGMRSDRAILSKEWFDEVKLRDDLVRPVDDTAAEAANWVEIRDIPELAGYKIRPDEGRFLARLYRADVNPQGPLKDFLHLWKEANRSFKAWTLSIFPSYHTRNAVGLMWNYYLGSENQFDGLRNLKLSQDAWGAIRGKKGAHWKLKGVINPETRKEWTADQIWRKVAENNGWGVGFVSAENPADIQAHIRYTKRWGVDDPESVLMRSAKDQWKFAIRNGLPGSKQPYVGPPHPSVAERIKLGLVGEHPWVEAGFRIGSYMDDRVRMAHILQRLKQGDTIEDAIRSSKKHFFDYSQLTPTERALRDYGLPFYSWSRKNIPYQLEMLVRRPDRMARFHSALQGWESSSQNPPEEKFLSEWMKKNFSVRIRKNKNGQYEYFAMKNWLPLVDIAEIFHGWEWLTQNLTPWIRVPVEEIANENFFTDRKIDYMNSLLHGERTYFGTGKGVGLDWRGVGVPNRLAHIIKSMRLPNTLHQIMDNPQELDVVSQIMRVLAGRTYPLDAGRSRYQLKKEFDQLSSDTRKAIHSAVFRGNRQDVPRLVEEYLRKRNKKLKSRGFK